ncbi:MAG: ABC transporter permease [Planktomarina sp.]|nr:ABC transporter permease [Planktomarina sp.]MDT2076799.1 ABC transporter permease [Planktomarina sp.]
MKLSPLNKRRLSNFKKNRRAVWSLFIFSILFGLSLFAEFLANDKPILVSYRGELFMPVTQFYPETTFGGDFKTEATYRDPEVQCLIRSGGLEICFEDPEITMDAISSGDLSVEIEDFYEGWMIWPLVPYSYDTPNDLGRSAPSPPDGQHWLGTDDTTRDVLARVIYGFRLSILFALIVTVFASIIGVIAGAIQGYFGGWLDLVFQRFLEVFSALPSLYVIIILTAILGRSFWLLVTLSIIFGWPALTGLIRAEFFRARNFEYVRAAQALGVSNWTIMMRHILPNAMVATLTFLPFIVTGAISTLAGLDFLGFGLPSSSPSLGELSQQAKLNLQSPHLGFTAFFVFTIMLSLLVFIFEGVRDAFDPRKVFS